MLVRFVVFVPRGVIPPSVTPPHLRGHDAGIERLKDLEGLVNALELRGEPVALALWTSDRAVRLTRIDSRTWTVDIDVADTIKTIIQADTELKPVAVLSRPVREVRGLGTARPAERIEVQYVARLAWRWVWAGPLGDPWRIARAGL